MRTLTRRLTTLAVAMLALTLTFFAQAPAEVASAAAHVIWVDDQPGNNDTVSCPVTSNLTLQDGIDDVTLPNTTVYVCEGVYTAPTTIFSKNNLKLIARGRVQLNPIAGYSGNFLWVGGSTNVTVQGFVINGNSSLGTGDANAIAYSASSGAILKNYIRNWRQPDLSATLGFEGRAIYVDYTGGPPAGTVKIDHNSIVDFQNFGIWVMYTNKATITHNLLTFSSGVGYLPKAILLEYASKGSVSSNTIRSTYPMWGGASSAWGVMMTETIAVKVSGNTISGVTDGIHIRSACTYGDTRNNKITGNKLNDISTGITLSLITGSCGHVYENNVISGNKFTATALKPYTGVELTASSSTPLAGTVIKGNTFTGYTDAAFGIVDITGVVIEPPVVSKNKMVFLPPPGI